MSEQSTAMTASALDQFMQHIPQLVQTKHVRAGVQGGGALGRINAAIAVRITKIVGTMYCAYIFTLIALVALPTAMPDGFGYPAHQLDLVELPAAGPAAHHHRRPERDL